MSGVADRPSPFEVAGFVVVLGADGLFHMEAENGSSPTALVPLTLVAVAVDGDGDDDCHKDAPERSVPALASNDVAPLRKIGWGEDAYIFPKSGNLLTSGCADRELLSSSRANAEGGDAVKEDSERVGE